MATVIVSKEARNDLVSIRRYIEEDLCNPDAANHIIRALRQCVESLTDLPERGTPLDTILRVHTEYRFLLCEKYCVFYLYDGSQVEVVRILHQLQDYLNALFNT